MSGRSEPRVRNAWPLYGTLDLHDNAQCVDKLLEKIHLSLERPFVVLSPPTVRSIGRGSMDELVTQCPEPRDKQNIQDSD